MKLNKYRLYVKNSAAIGGSQRVRPAGTVSAATGDIALREARSAAPLGIVVVKVKLLRR